MTRVALFTFGLFREAAEHPSNQGFHDRNDANLAAAERSDGFIDRSGYDGDPGPQSWGVQVYPHFYVERGDGWSPATLSLWRDLESIVAFVYSGIHAEALSHGRQWFLKGEWPPYVAWWVADDHRPDWAEGVARYEYLHEHGASPHAFNLRQPYSADGNRIEIDRKRVKAKVDANAA